MIAIIISGFIVTLILLKVLQKLINIEIDERVNEWSRKAKIPKSIRSLIGVKVLWK